MPREPFSLPEEQCERLVRQELLAVRWIMAALDILVPAKKDIEKRLSIIPDGIERMDEVIRLMKELSDDIAGTINRNQCRHIWNTYKDFELRLVPKLSPGSTNLILEKEQGKILIDSARVKCNDCVEDENSCRKCDLYKILEATTPMDEYVGMICPYSLATWMN